MKLPEFISTLKRDKEVRFPEGPKLETRADLLAEMLAEGLPRLLPLDTNVHSGWQTKRMGDNWSGEHEWLLIIGDELVRVCAKAGERDRQKRDISVRGLPLQTAPKMVLTYSVSVVGVPRDEVVQREKLEAAHIELPIEGEDPLKAQAAGSGELEAFMHFGRHLRDAIARARAARGSS